jgi:hypothetical protein
MRITKEQIEKFMALPGIDEFLEKTSAAEGFITKVVGPEFIKFFDFCNDQHCELDSWDWEPNRVRESLGLVYHKFGVIRDAQARQSFRALLPDIAHYFDAVAHFLEEVAKDHE